MRRKARFCGAMELFHAAAEEHWKSSRSPVDARCFACCRAGRSGSNFGS